MKPEEWRQPEDEPTVPPMTEEEFFMVVKNSNGRNGPGGSGGGGFKCSCGNSFSSAVALAYHKATQHLR